MNPTNLTDKQLLTWECYLQNNNYIQREGIRETIDFDKLINDPMWDKPQQALTPKHLILKMKVAMVMIITINLFYFRKL